jgi:hypothetical protein
MSARPADSRRVLDPRENRARGIGRDSAALTDGRPGLGRSGKRHHSADATARVSASSSGQALASAAWPMACDCIGDLRASAGLGGVGVAARRGEQPRGPRTITWLRLSSCSSRRARARWLLRHGWSSLPRCASDARDSFHPASTPATREPRLASLPHWYQECGLRARCSCRSGSLLSVPHDGGSRVERGGGSARRCARSSRSHWLRCPQPVPACSTPPQERANRNELTLTTWLIAGMSAG